MQFAHAARVRACARASVAQCASGARVLAFGRGTTRCEEEGKTVDRKKGGNPEQEKRRCARTSRPPRVMEAACEVLHRRKALRARCGAERTEGSGSGACGVVRAATSFLHDDPVYLQAVDARASGCIGISWQRCTTMRAQMPTWRRTAMRMSRRSRGRHSYTARSQRSSP